jgi:hypothetical protein
VVPKSITDGIANGRGSTRKRGLSHPFCTERSRPVIVLNEFNREGRHVIHLWEAILERVCVHELAVIIKELLEQSSAKSERRTAFDLTNSRAVVQGRSDVGNRGIVENADFSRVEVDLDFDPRRPGCPMVNDAKGLVR